MLLHPLVCQWHKNNRTSLSLFQFRFNGQTIVYGVATANQSNIHSLIRSQKENKANTNRPYLPRTPFSQSSYNSSGSRQFSGRPQWNVSPQNGKRNYWKGNNPNDQRSNDRWEAENEAKSSRPTFNGFEDDQNDHPKSARSSSEASRSASITENDVEQENGFEGSSHYRRRSRRESGGSLRSRSDSRSDEHENGSLENRMVIEKPDSNDSSIERRIDQHRSPKTHSTESLNKKTKFSDDIFKLRLYVKTIDSKF